MVSMKNATDNANDLIDELTLEFNKLRQDNITTRTAGHRQRSSGVHLNIQLSPFGNR